MPWIRTVSVDAASGRLAESYRVAVERAGRVFGILRTMSLQPAVLDASVGLYTAIMKAPGDLSLVQREMLATVVSRANDCHYWMLQHADDLRAEIAREGGDAGLADAVLADWRTAPLGPVDAALCAYAEKLTREPAAMTEADLEPLRAAGLGDRAIHLAVQVVAFFNYINRVADAVHVELEPEMPPYPDGSR